METFFLILIIAFYSFGLKAQEQVDQPKVKSNQFQWTYSKGGCADKMSVTFENLSGKYIKEITFKLIISSSQGNPIYKKAHTVKLNLAEGDVLPSPYFKIPVDVCMSDMINNGYNTEIISIK